MVDTVDSLTRSRMMSGIRSKDTKPERVIRSFLHREGFRFRLHRKVLSSRPDIVLQKYKLAIFVHGCFWHRHLGCPRATTPGTNPESWQRKFNANVERDKRNVLQLREAGWRVFVLWECAIDDQVNTRLQWLAGAIKDVDQLFIEWPAPDATPTVGARIKYKVIAPHGVGHGWRQWPWTGGGNAPP